MRARATPPWVGGDLCRWTPCVHGPNRLRGADPAACAPQWARSDLVIRGRRPEPQGKKVAMPLDDLTKPVIAENLAKFGPGDAGKAAQINYNVPLPGAHSWDRVVVLELPEEWFTDNARQAGTSLRDLGIVRVDQGRFGVQRDRLAQFYRRAVPPAAPPSPPPVSPVVGDDRPP